MFFRSTWQRAGFQNAFSDDRQAQIFKLAREVSKINGSCGYGGDYSLNEEYGFIFSFLVRIRLRT